MKMRKKWTATATAVRLLLLAFLFAQHGPTALSWATDDATAAASSSAAEHESVVDNFFAAYFEQPCCVRPRHVRHHKSECLRVFYVQTVFKKSKLISIFIMHYTGVRVLIFTYYNLLCVHQVFRGCSVQLGGKKWWLRG